MHLPTESRASSRFGAASGIPMLALALVAAGALFALALVASVLRPRE